MFKATEPMLIGQWWKVPKVIHELNGMFRSFKILKGDHLPKMYLQRSHNFTVYIFLMFALILLLSSLYGYLV